MAVGQWHRLLVRSLRLISTKGNHVWKVKISQDDCDTGKHARMLLRWAATGIVCGGRRIDTRKLRLQTAEVGGSRRKELRMALQQKTRLRRNTRSDKERAAR